MDAPIQIHAIVGMEDSEMMKLDRLRALATLAGCVMAFALSACAEDNPRAAPADNVAPPVGDSLREALKGANACCCAAPIPLGLASDGTINPTASAMGNRVLPLVTKSNSISMDGASGGQGHRNFPIDAAANARATASGNPPFAALVNFRIAYLTLQNGCLRGGRTAGPGGVGFDHKSRSDMSGAGLGESATSQAAGQSQVKIIYEKRTQPI